MKCSNMADVIANVTDGIATGQCVGYLLSF